MTVGSNASCEPALNPVVRRWMAYNLLLLVGSLLIVTGVVTSLLSFAMFTRDRVTPKTTRFMLKTLSLTDAFFLILVCGYVQVGLLKGFSRDAGHNRTSAFIRAFYNSGYYHKPLFHSLQVIEMFRNWITVLIGIERFIVVCQPLRAHHLCAKGRFVIATIVIFICSVLFRFPLIFSATMIADHHPPTNNTNATNAAKMYMNALANWHDILGVIFVMMVPLVILLICSVYIIHELRNSWTSGVGNCSQSPSGYRKRNLKVTRMLLTVIIIYFVCSLPAVVAVITKFFPSCVARTMWRILRYVFQLCSLTFSTSNFFVYILFMKRYRLILRKMFIGRWQRASSQTGACHHMYSTTKENDQDSTWV